MKKYLGAIISGIVMLLFILCYLLFPMVFAASSGELGILVFAVIPLIFLWFLINAIVQRIHEIKEGEDDDYSDY